MAKKSKYELAKRLLNGGYFSQYKGDANRLAKDTTWENLQAYYFEMIDYEQNVKGIE